MYQFVFLSSVFRISLHVSLAPSESFNDKEKCQFLWKDLYLHLYGIICNGNAVVIILVF